MSLRSRIGRVEAEIGRRRPPVDMSKVGDAVQLMAAAVRSILEAAIAEAEEAGSPKYPPLRNGGRLLLSRLEEAVREQEAARLALPDGATEHEIAAECWRRRNLTDPEIADDTGPS